METNSSSPSLELKMKISKRKKYKTRCGYPVRIYATDGMEPYSVHGAVEISNDWIINIWHSDGSSNIDYSSRYDLIEIKPKKRAKK